ncbi:hypothetical protein QN382_19110 [Pseudomonas sp. 10B1]|uniref:hypothetical protein n=1 Tax=unclassified Pseudomonas TaxID=196821 RepID=UPI002B23E060|nr:MULTISPECIES: hypothetical protein [unclassified Pseudomonas]MEA9994302.1 hypothetical protein [Pseudomonas sp. AA4]MEB0088521.1 hypothetical protein [Pseudomonas sp. RTI1]MEB0126556.1 hypothetical protein [Pseudomonas sp. CCC1.2]MEB0154631.1 hypothetical protein [Pseudomonas sp. CCC4.3]MEB0221152.1 hypothetical protein [Pseudomonas sp. AB12(2023)]
MKTINRIAPPQEPRQAPVVVGPWPTYGQFKFLPEQQRWTLYGSAKAYREALESAGFVMSEIYDDFIKRVTRELDI